MLPPSPPDPTPLNEQDVHGVCRNAVLTGKAFNHSEDKSLN